MNNIRFDDWEARQMEDPEFRAAVEELEAAYLVARLRIKRGLTQAQLAGLVGTKQSSIARLESGASQPRLSFLRRIIEALGGRLELNVIDPGEAKRELPENRVTTIANKAGENIQYERLNIKQPNYIYAQIFTLTTETITQRRVLQ
jgi:transcriptional regulator with XRE-family HTH domain